MTRSQVRVMELVHQAAGEVDRSQVLLDAEKASFSGLLYDALNEGIPARILAQALGLSLSRVYQIRDEVSDYRK